MNLSFYSRRTTAPLTRIGAVCVALSLSACASFQPIAAKTAPASDIALTIPTSMQQTENAYPQSDWWGAYGDPQLDGLIAHALANSPTLAAAQARIARARASADFSHAASAPQLNAGADLSYGRQSENYLLPRPPLGIGGESISQGLVALNFGYELDLWGKNAALIRATEAQVQAANFDKEAARLALTTSIARTYVQLAAQYELQVRKLVDQRVASGLDTRVEVKQAETNEVALRIDIEQLATAIKVTRLQLAALTGDMPNSAETIARPALLTGRFTMPQTLALDLLRRRPIALIRALGGGFMDTTPPSSTPTNTDTKQQGKV